MYDFQSLSPLDFEELVRDLLQAELKRRLESFGPGSDLGIDFRSSVAGTLIVQAKHYGRSGGVKLLRAVAAENVKVAMLKRRPRRYILATSVSLSPALKQKIIDAMPSTPLRAGDVFGLEDLNSLLGRHADIERQHFKLWLSSTVVLERILHSGVYNRTGTEMDIVRDMVPRFVQNRSVAEAGKILADQGTLVIAGEPGVGKSTLARMLVWLHAEQGWRIFVVDDIREAYEIANEGEKRLIFFDDFLGQVQLSADLVRGMDQRLPPFLDRVRRNKDMRFILTTRDYILSIAQTLSARLAGKAVTDKRYVLNVNAYTRSTRARILYNHIYFSKLSADDKTALLADRFYLRIIDHPNFNPRLIQTLTNVDYAIAAEEPIRNAVLRVLTNPQELWDRPYRQHITRDAQGLLLAVLFNKREVPLAQLQESFERIGRALELHIARAEIHARFRQALRELEGSIIAIVQRHAQFANPGVRDYLQAVVVEDRALPPIIEQLATIDELRQCWTIWEGKANKPNQTESDQHRWLNALERIWATRSGTVLQRLEIAIDIYNRFESVGALRWVRSAGEDLANSGFDISDTQEVCFALEITKMSPCPEADMEAIRHTITKKAAELLEQDGYAMMLDQIDALGNALQRYGSNPLVAQRASRASLIGFIRALDDHLDEISSVSDLDSFEEELNRVLQRRDIVDSRVKHDIQSRRERLSELEDERDGDGYKPTSQPAGPQGGEMSNAEIQSMFSGLIATG